MKIMENIYPYNIEVKKLPIHLAGIGGTDYQYHVIRPEGYHWHQILFSSGGNGFLTYDNQTVPVSEGDFFFLPAGYPHEYYSENPKWEVWWVAFDGYACTHILSQFQMTKPVVIRPQESSALQRICYKMYSAQKTDKMYCDYSCSGYVYDYLIEFHHFMDSKLNKLRNERNKLLLPVLNYIDDNFRSDFPLTALADLAGITPQHLCRVFKETMNMRPVEYLTQKRLSEAKRLLQRNEQSISEIAVLSGFTDVRYFSTVFKKHEGMTPMDYKKRIGVK